MDARIKLLNDLQKLKKKMEDTRCKHLLKQYEVVYQSTTKVLTMIDDLMIGNSIKSMTPNKAYYN